MKNRIALRIAALAAVTAFAGQALAIIDSTTDNQLPSMRGELPGVTTEEVYTAPVDTYNSCPRKTCSSCPRLRCHTCPRRTCNTCVRAPKVHRSCNSCNRCSSRSEVGEMDDVMVDEGPFLNDDRVLGVEAVEIDADYTASVIKGNQDYRDEQSDIEEMQSGGDYANGWY